MYQRTRQSVSGTQQSQEMQSLVPSPLTSAPPANVQKLRAATDIATETFTQQQFEAFGLQIKADIGTIAPEEQERLGWLQAEMDDFWTQRLEQSSQFGRPLTQIPLHPPNQAKSASQMHSQKAPQMPLLPIQTKLTIGAVGDRYEQEADRVAAKVVEQIHSPTTSQMHPNAAVQRQIQSQEESEERLRMMPVQRLPIHGSLQRVAMADEIPVGEASVPFETVVNQRRGGGQPLEHDLQRSMEQAMGADFSRVRIHTDAQSDGLNRSIQAQAFTTGQDVFFRGGVYQPGSRSGQEVIAHELTHVMQQNQQRNSGLIQRGIYKPGTRNVYDQSRKFPFKSVVDPTDSAGKKLSDTLNISQQNALQRIHEAGPPHKYLNKAVNNVKSNPSNAMGGRVVRSGNRVSTLLEVENAVTSSGLDATQVQPILARFPSIYGSSLDMNTFLDTDFHPSGLGVKINAPPAQVASAVISQITQLPGTLTSGRQQLEENFLDMKTKTSHLVVANQHMGTAFEKHVQTFQVPGVTGKQVVFTDQTLLTVNTSNSRRADLYSASDKTIYEMKKFDKGGTTTADDDQAKEYAIIRDKKIKGAKGEEVDHVIYIFSNKEAAKRHRKYLSVPYKHKVKYLSKKNNQLADLV
ncbi:MAG: hypothetical protein B0A82_12740 [Alkalinema sp. CACIAM 70d]|nr:MAG: hypothetical protein B0A82_12740 [Alkalinema sp. CACIAM 70d]